MKEVLTEKKPEILAPTSSYESVVAALNAGCDAIYIGGQHFGARAYADNPDNESLKEIIKECRLRDVKVFVTVNTLYKQNELDEVVSFVKELYLMGVYGVIVQDLGLFYIIKKVCPELKISASTQMTVHNVEAVRMLEKAGFDRIVLARELNENEIAEICARSHVETEMFIHGALCVSYSGRCYLSSFIGGRSGNRGRCAQPCRMTYDFYEGKNKIASGYLLSPKDASLIEECDRIVSLGVDSLKIEGRMKSPEYVYQTVSAYRKYIDLAYDGLNSTVSDEDKRALLQIFNRGGSSTSGYYNGFAGREMMSLNQKNTGTLIGKVISVKKNNATIRLEKNVIPGDGIEIWSKPEHTGTYLSENAKAGEIITVKLKKSVNKGDKVYLSFDKALNDLLSSNCKTLTRRRRVDISVKAHIGEKITVIVPEFNTQVYGEMVTKAENNPLESETIVSKLTQTGNTPFILNITACDIEKNIFVPLASLKELKRNVVSAIEDSILSHNRSVSELKEESIADNSYSEPKLSVRVHNTEQLKAAINEGVSRIYTSEYTLTDISEAHKKGIEIFYALPHIIRGGSEEYVTKASACDGLLLTSHTDLKTEKPTALDYTFNILNSECIKQLEKMYSPVSYTLSVEGTIDELMPLSGGKSELVVYGRLPLMTTHQCPVGLYKANKKNGKFCSFKDKHGDYYIVDKMGEKYPVVRDCEQCYAQILSSSPIYVPTKAEKIKKYNFGYYRLEFTTETAETVKRIIREYSAFIGKKSDFPKDGNQGHLFKGVL